MVKPNNYTDSELITQLIDGELSGEQKGYILAKLSMDNTLNRQFKLESAISKAAQSKPKYEPSEKLTNDLFNKLGFSNGNNEKPFIPWLSTLKKASVFLAAGLALTLIGYYTFTTMESTKKPENHTLTVKKIPVVSSSSITETIISTDKNLANKNVVSVKKGKTAKVTKSKNSETDISKKASNGSEKLSDNYSKTNELKSEDNTLIEKSESPINLEATPSLEEITTSNLFNNTSSLGNLFDKQDPFVLQINPLKSGTRYYEQFNPNNEISVKAMNPYQTNTFMTTGGIAVTYYRQWKDGFKIGVEAGFENINRWTYDAQTTSKSLTNSQALSLSGILRYDAEFVKFANINPFVQSFIGFGTNFNYVYGGTIGLMYNPPLTRFGLQAGYEYRKFDYYFGSDNTSTMSFEKSGPTVSLIIKF
jgi:hypothetical protein